MDYTLAKELKDAGFPQKGGWEDPKQHEYWSTYDGGASKKKPEIITSDEANFGFMEDLFYIPTLEELIEACGDEFYSVVYATDNDWRAFSETDQWNTTATAGGKTQSEAVARLWLSLKRTDTQ